MKKVKIDFFGAEEEIYFDISRIMEVEKATGLSIGQIIMSQQLNMSNLAVLLMIGMKHTTHKKAVSNWAEEIEKALNDGVEIMEIQEAVSKALVGSGILGKAAYYKVFPEELTPETKAEIIKN